MDRIIRVRELSAVIGISRSAIYDRLNKKSPRYDVNFPRPVKLGGVEKSGAIGWYASEIEAWIESRRPDCMS